MLPPVLRSRLAEVAAVVKATLAGNPLPALDAIAGASIVYAEQGHSAAAPPSLPPLPPAPRPAALASAAANTIFVPEPEIIDPQMEALARAPLLAALGVTMLLASPSAAPASQRRRSALTCRNIAPADASLPHAAAPPSPGLEARAASAALIHARLRTECDAFLRCSIAPLAVEATAGDEVGEVGLDLGPGAAKSANAIVPETISSGVAAAVATATVAAAAPRPSSSDTIRVLLPPGSGKRRRAGDQPVADQPDAAAPSEETAQTKTKKNRSNPFLS
jgi:hypothetical protein